MRRARPDSHRWMPFTSRDVVACNRRDTAPGSVL